MIISDTYLQQQMIRGRIHQFRRKRLCICQIRTIIYQADTDNTIRTDYK